MCVCNMHVCGGECAHVCTCVGRVVVSVHMCTCVGGGCACICVCEFRFECVHACVSFTFLLNARHYKRTFRTEVSAPQIDLRRDESAW